MSDTAKKAAAWAVVVALLVFYVTAVNVAAERMNDDADARRAVIELKRDK